MAPIQEWWPSGPRIRPTTGEAGDTTGAWDLFAALLADQLRVLGADHPDTLTTRTNLATLDL